jgi:hypothetical protein
MTTVKCRKDLFHKNGTQLFTKGRIYPVQNNPESLNAAIIINDLGQRRIIWSDTNNFKAISK